MLSAKPRESGEASERQRHTPQADGGKGAECVLRGGNIMYEAGKVSGKNPVWLGPRATVS